MNYQHLWINPDGDNANSGEHVEEPKKDWENTGGILSVLDTDLVNVIHHAKGFYEPATELDLQTYKMILLGGPQFFHLLDPSVRYAVPTSTGRMLTFAQPSEIRGICFQGSKGVTDTAAITIKGPIKFKDVIFMINDTGTAGLVIENNGLPEIESAIFVPNLTTPADGSYLLKYMCDNGYFPITIKNSLFMFDSTHPTTPFTESQIWYEGPGTDGKIYAQNNCYIDFHAFHNAPSELLLEKNAHPSGATNKDPWPVAQIGLNMVPVASSEALREALYLEQNAKLLNAILRGKNG